MIEISTIGAGGGSIASVDAGGLLQVGPESAGAAPGPACFALGGNRPTPTDAWLVLGYLTPDYYLGGRKHLDSELARRALATVAEPLGVSVEEAALTICDAAERTAAEGIEELLARPGVRELVGQRDRSDLALIAYGGGGGLLLPGAARRLGLRATVISRYSPVFSAFGVSTFDVRHRYEACVTVDGERPGPVVGELAEAARRDMRGEGFAPSQVDLHLTVSDLNGTRLAEVPADMASELDLPSGHPLIFELRASCPVPKPALPHEEATPSEPAPRTRREVWLAGGRQEIPLYDRDALAAGAELAGPALIEASDTTYLVPEGSRCRVHESGSAIIEGP
jgi:N-methylhydantoinase A/acetophenone carboxylase